MFRSRFRSRARFFAGGAGPVGPWNPAQLGADLALWLDADDAATITLNGSTVSQWDDKSGNDNNAVQASASRQPLLVGNEVVFDGTELMELTTGIASLNSVSGFYVGRYAANVGAQNYMVFAIGTGNQRFYNGAIESTFTDFIWTLGEDVNFATSTANTDTNIVEMTHGSGVATALLNGVTIGTTADPTTASLTNWFLGATNATTPRLDGAISEVVVLSVDASLSDRQKIEGYLAWKWGGIPQTRAWTPADLDADLALWLDADDADTITLNGSNVSQWNDKSGNGRNLSQATAAAQPTYLSVGFSGKPSLRTDGTDSLAAGATSLGRNVGGLTAAIVGMYPVGATLNGNACDIIIYATSVGPTRFYLGPNPSASTANRYAVAGRRLDTDGFASVSSTTDSLANRGNPWIRIGQRAYSDGVANHWTNGTQDITDFALQGAGNTSDTDSAQTFIFAGVSNVPPNTELSEIVLTHSTMTTTDRQRLEGYLAHKWDLTANLPVDHPYKDAAPTVAI